MNGNFNIKSIVSLLLITFAIFILLVVIGKVLIPFLIALILTYVLNPMIEKLTQKFRIRRSIISLIISILVFIIFVLIPLLVIPTIIVRLKAIIIKFPNFIKIFNEHILADINNKYNLNLSLNLNDIKGLLVNNISKIYDHSNIFSPLAKNSFIIIEIMVCIILIPFILFYTINNWHKIIDFFDSLIPKSYLNMVHSVILDIDLMLSAYLRGQLSVMLVMACYYSIGLYIVGLPSGASIGILSGLLVFIPYLGVLTGLLLSLSISFAEITAMNQQGYVRLIYKN